MIDDNARIRSEDNVLKMVRHVNGYRTAFNKGSAFEVTSLDIAAVPSLMRSLAAIRTTEGRAALKQLGMSEGQFRATYERLAPKLLAAAYHILQTKPQLASSDLPGRLAQTAFELNIMPPETPSSQHRFLQLVGEQDLAAFEKVRSQTIDYAFLRLRMIAGRVEGGANALADTYQNERSSSRFLNHIFQDVAEPYAFEILNALEFSGYDLDNEEILRETLYETRHSQIRTHQPDSVRLG